MRWRHHSGQVALVRNGRKDLHSQWNDARPDGERIIFLIVLGTAGAYLGRGFAERQRQYGRRLPHINALVHNNSHFGLHLICDALIDCLVSWNNLQRFAGFYY